MKPDKRSSLTLRLPEPLRAWLADQAKENFTSQNDEIVRSIRERMEAATGAKFGDQTPAAALNTAALQSGDIINQALEMPDDHQGI